MEGVALPFEYYRSPDCFGESEEMSLNKINTRGFIIIHSYIASVSGGAEQTPVQYQKAYPDAGVAVRVISVF